MHDDVYQMYLDEIAAIRPMDAAEEAQLLEKPPASYCRT